ncbi:RNA polymerase sigma factor [Clostridium gasigenes]|uniref:RNA polymerase sigma factor n=1 Tax=Clostridium gasigenes TaxID=94869 RepID=UPI00209AA6C9|nr:sigma-70 family RNA polymerase sigma factor [Clostridium gasigenes]
MELIKIFERGKRDKISCIKLAKSKDKEAFTNLIHENLTSMYRVARGILSTGQDVEDAMQNTTLIAFNKITTLRDEKFFKTWIIRILINECNKIYKCNKRSINEIIEAGYTIDTTNNIDLYNAISRLSDELRVSTILFYFDDLTYKEISNVLGVPEGTVKSRVFRAKHGLYEMLKDEE